MGALQQVTVPTRVIADTSAMEACGLAELCTIRYESEERFYDVTLAAAIARVALEGMNRFEIAIRGTHKCTGIRDKLHAVLEINIREEMNCISIEGDAPLFFTISRRSLDPLDEDIDSSIHEVIDLGLLERRIHAAPRSKESRQACLLFDEAAANLVKASVSALLGHATECHRHVIQEANHLFACRQDYVREMCKSLVRNTGAMATSVTSKAIFCNQGLF